MNIGQGPKVPTTNLVDDRRSSDKFGELFKWINSPYCETTFYANLTSDNKLQIIDDMTNDASFMDTAKTFVSDENVIRSKVETKLEQILKKKMPRLVTPHELFLANQNGISAELDKRTKNTTLHNGVNEGPIIQVFTEFDEEKGNHIGSGIYLKREEHLIKMTTPNFTVYY